MEKSLIEYAFDCVNAAKDSLPFATIWSYVKNEAGLSDEEAAKRVGQFYTNLLLDGRFVTLGDNVWDLRARHTFDKVHIDMKDVYSDVETSDDDKEDLEEEKEYNKVLSDDSEEENDDELQSENDEEESSEEETY